MLHSGNSAAMGADCADLSIFLGIRLELLLPLQLSRCHVLDILADGYRNLATAVSDTFGIEMKESAIVSEDA